MKELSLKLRQAILGMQLNEETEYVIYHKIAEGINDPENKKILKQIGDEEKLHAAIWQGYTKAVVKVNSFKVFWYTMISKIFGYTFALKLMEKGENKAQASYNLLTEEIPEAAKIKADEEHHEQELLKMLDEERLRYVGSMVLGLNDALVELTGTLAGLTFALQNNKLVALSGLITGISATFSMASSEFLSARSEGREDALKSCTYTGIAYLVTVFLLVIPYLIAPADGYLISLISMLFIVVMIILVFNYYISVAQDLNFKKRFAEMASISLGVAFLSFLVGLLVKRFLGIDV
ncbi:VIT1/CCC1 transporter family protein [Alloiococcus sp. CFN-8]|uniref:VIT1/CCC1 transporter family protein n=1 Tax=Alloiococcus sp. CFN-8 TaxID=3416081 RepID=UPI003CF8DF16